MVPQKEMAAVGQGEKLRYWDAGGDQGGVLRADHVPVPGQHQGGGPDGPQLLRREGGLLGHQLQNFPVAPGLGGDRRQPPAKPGPHLAGQLGEELDPRRAEVAAHEHQPPQLLRVVQGEVEGHIGPVGKAHQVGPFDPQGRQHPGQVIGHAPQGDPLPPGGLPVAPAVHRHHRKPPGEGAYHPGKAPVVLPVAVEEGHRRALPAKPPPADERPVGHGDKPLGVGGFAAIHSHVDHTSGQYPTVACLPLRTMGVLMSPGNSSSFCWMFSGLAR